MDIWQKRDYLAGKGLKRQILLVPMSERKVGIPLNLKGELRKAGDSHKYLGDGGYMALNRVHSADQGK